MTAVQQNSATHPHKLVAEGYDVCADTYKTLFSLKPSSTRSRWTDELVSSLSPGSTVIELGCGSGDMTIPFIQRGCKVTAVDISAKQIELARKAIPQATILHTDMMSLDFPPNTFDAVAAFYSILHLPFEEQGIIMERITGWLKPGGVVVANFPSEGSENSEDVVEHWLGATMYWRGLGVEGNRNLFKNHGKGLTVIKDEVVEDVLQEDTAASVSAPTETFHWIWAVKDAA
jgi:ubiquinone/menaquinone biosynthesis C-methylase UbiE